MAQLVGKVTQEFGKPKQGGYKSGMEYFGRCVEHYESFRIHLFRQYGAVRCAHKSESVTRELPGSGEYVGKFTLSSTSGKTEHKENKVLLKCTKHQKQPERLVLVNGTDLTNSANSKYMVQSKSLRKFSKW